MNTILLRGTRALWLAGALSALAPAAWAQATAGDALAFTVAMEAYRNNHWPQSYAQLASLADRGHVEAARIASQMHRWGPRLYGQHFHADAERLAHWQRHAHAAAAAIAASTATAARSP